MLREVIARIRNLSKPSDYFDTAYEAAYHKGLHEGRDFGKRIAHNSTLASELPDILTRYSKLQLKVLNKPKSVMAHELGRFQADEVMRLKMELQNR